MTQYIQVITTTEQQVDAQRIAADLVDRRLAACVQVSGPITSTYRWQNQVETAQEWQCAIKSRLDLYDQLEAAIRQLHPYDTPEILALPIERGSRAYLEWMQQELSAGD